MAVAGFTLMPHTGSFSRAGDGGAAGLEAVILNRASGFGFRASAKPRFSRSPQAEARSPFLIADTLYWIQLRQPAGRGNFIIPKGFCDDIFGCGVPLRGQARRK